MTIPVTDLQELIKILECYSLAQIESLTIGINELINEELELIAHSTNLSNLKNLKFKLDSDFERKVNQD